MLLNVSYYQVTGRRSDGGNLFAGAPQVPLRCLSCMDRKRALLALSPLCLLNLEEVGWRVDVLSELSALVSAVSLSRCQWHSISRELNSCPASRPSPQLNFVGCGGRQVNLLCAENNRLSVWLSLLISKEVLGQISGVLDLDKTPFQSFYSQIKVRCNIITLGVVPKVSTLYLTSTVFY